VTCLSQEALEGGATEWSGEESAGETWNAEDQAEVDAFVPEQGQGNTQLLNIL